MSLSVTHKDLLYTSGTDVIESSCNRVSTAFLMFAIASKALIFEWGSLNLFAPLSCQRWRKKGKIFMHIDLAHAVVSAMLILLVIFVMRETGMAATAKEKRFDWKIFVGIFVVMFIFNLLWPY